MEDTDKTIQVRKEETFDRKIELLSSRLNWARAFGKTQMIDQLQRMYTQLMMEKAEKDYVERFTEMCKNTPRVIESDPDLVPKDQQQKKNDFFGNNFDKTKKVKKRLF